MDLDLETLMVSSSLVAGFSGLFLLFAWLQYRGTRAALFWAISDLLACVGLLLIVMPSPVLVPLGRAFAFLSAVVTLVAVRSFERLPGRPLVVVGGVVGAMIVIGTAGKLSPGNATGLAYAVLATVLLATAETIRRGWRRERLAARWPLAGLFLVHAAVFLLAIPEALTFTAIPFGPPPLTGWFGIIHFENVLFHIGSAIFLVTLIKERSEVRLAAAARLDPLTETASRGSFLEQAGAILERCRRAGRPVSVLVFDLDFFKQINDGHGHATGDQVLHMFGATLRRNLRRGDLPGRIGGEEFAVILPGTGSAGGFALAERIRMAFGEACRFVGGERIGGTVSAGIAEVGSPDVTLEQLLARADQALYRAKRSGRNRVEMGDLPPIPEGLAVARIA